MKLVYPHDVPRLGIVRTFRHSRLAPLLTFLFVAAGTTWWTLTMLISGEAQWLHWLPTLLGVIMCLILLIYVRKAFKATNWLVKAAQDGLYIKFRSYLNDGLPETGPTIVQIPYSEIACIRPAWRTLKLPDSDGRTTTNHMRFLDIDLRHSATNELAAALQAERAVPPVRNGAAKHHDYPLRVIAPDRLRLAWKVHPGLSVAVETMDPFVTADKKEARTKSDWVALDKPAKEAMIVELVELGERLRAAQLAKELYNLDTTEAKTYIDDLMGRAPSSSGSPRD